jgi:hypothetical protein
MEGNSFDILNRIRDRSFGTDPDSEVKLPDPPKTDIDECQGNLCRGALQLGGIEVDDQRDFCTGGTCPRRFSIDRCFAINASNILCK